MSIKKWHEVYSGQDERDFFVGKNGTSGLVRSPYDYRSAKALAKESGLSEERVEQIINKYLKLSIIIQSDSKDDHYGYWLRVAPHLGSTTHQTITQADQNDRMKKAGNAKKP